MNDTSRSIDISAPSDAELESDPALREQVLVTLIEQAWLEAARAVSNTASALDIASRLLPVGGRQLRRKAIGEVEREIDARLIVSAGELAIIDQVVVSLREADRGPVDPNTESARKDGISEIAEIVEATKAALAKIRRS